VLRSDDDKIVVHHGIALHAMPFRNEYRVFGAARIGVALLALPDQRSERAVGKGNAVEAAVEQRVGNSGLLHRHGAAHRKGTCLKEQTHSSSLSPSLWGGGRGDFSVSRAQACSGGAALGFTPTRALRSDLDLPKVL